MAWNVPIGDEKNIPAPPVSVFCGLENPAQTQLKRLGTRAVGLPKTGGGRWKYGPSSEF